jgi:UDP-GlcNAc:undecaprenyl-phosphate/decaprenyl-phosphate GlcNAc-1-phosphate transferase
VFSGQVETVSDFLQMLGIRGSLEVGVLPVVLIFLTAMATTWFFIPRVRDFAVERGLGDKPNERRLNKELLPNVGGLTVFAGVIAAMVLAIAIKPLLLATVNIQLLSIALGGAIMVLVGFIDDQFELPSLFRIVVQVLCAGLLVVNGIRIDLPFLPIWADVFLTVFWVVGITNAVNLLDGIDGNVGGLGFITAMSMLALSAQFSTRGAATLLLAALAGACLGFLRHNFNPSRIILGDAGATFIGFTLAAVSMLGTLKVSAAVSVLAPVIVLLVPILDTTQVTIRRILRGVRPDTPGKDHLHHLLLKRGLDQRRSVVTLWAATLMLSVISMLLQRVNILVIGLSVLVTILALAFVAQQRILEVKRTLQTKGSSSA